MFQSLPRLSLGDRRLQVAAGAFVLVAVCGAFAGAIATGNLQSTVRLLLLVAAPAFIVLALRRPLIPYALYVLAVPFDNLLLVSGIGSITKLLGFAAMLFILIDVVRRRRFGRPSYVLYIFLAYLFYNTLSLLWTIDTQSASGDMQVLLSNVALYALLCIAPVTERDLRALCSCIVASGVAASLYGIYILHSAANALSDDGRLTIEVGTRSVDPNHYANSLLAPLAFALVAIAHARRPANFIAAATAVIILGAGIEISLSREALLAAFVMALVLAWFSRRRFMSFAALSAAFVLLPLFFPAIGIRVMGAFATGGAGRFSIWHVGWRSFTQHPIFGWGIGSAVAAYDRNFLTVYQAYSTGWTRPPHNTPLHILVDLGIVGLVLAGLGIAASFRGLGGIRRGEPLYDLRAALTASLAGVVIVSFFIDLATYKYLWLVIATTAQFSFVARARRAALAPAVPVAGRGPRKTRFLSPVRALVLAFGVLTLALPCAALLQWLAHTNDAAGENPPPAVRVAAHRAKTIPRGDARRAPGGIALRVIDDAPSIAGGFTYSGAWEHLKNVRDGRSGGTSSRAFHAGATATLVFSGRSLRLYGVKGIGGGSARLLIDGADFGTLRFYAPHKVLSALVFDTAALRPGPHVAAVVVVPPSLVSFKRGFVNLDGAAYAP